jgi:hypothetical protein
MRICSNLASRSPQSRQPVPHDHGIDPIRQGRFTTNSKQVLFVFEQNHRSNAAPTQGMQIVRALSFKPRANGAEVQTAPH